MCQDSCLTTPEVEPEISSDVMTPVLEPVLEPFVVEGNQDGLYNITIPTMTDNSMPLAGSDSVLIGSGDDAGNDVIPMTGSGEGHHEVYLVRVTWEGSKEGNNTYYALVRLIAPPLSLCLLLSISLALTLSLTLPLSLSHTHTHSLSLSLSLSHAHTHTHSLSADLTE